MYRKRTMAYIQQILSFVLLCAIMASVAQDNQGTSRRRVPGRPTGGSLIWLGGAHAAHGNHGSQTGQSGNQTSQDLSNENQSRFRRDAQGGPHVNQDGSHSLQGDPHVNQGRVRRQAHQGGSHTDQDGPHTDQGGPHENQGRVRRQAHQGGSHTSQGGSHVDQGGSKENQGRVRRQADDIDYEEAGILVSQKNWTTCDPIAFPRISCYDCITRLICKNVGGLIKPCNYSLKPYCNNGVCSAIPSTECMKY